jgi:MFS family permease
MGVRRLRLLILTPEAHVYAVTALAICSAVCAPLAGYLQAWWPRAQPPRFLPVYVATMTLVAVLALLLLRLPSLTRISWAALAVSVPVGLAAGGLAICCDSTTWRLLRRRKRNRGRLQGPRISRNLSSPGAAGSDWLAPAPFGREASPVSLLSLLIAVAALEEVLFRGVLVDLILVLSSPALVVVFLTLTVVCFALSHLYWGWGEVLAKSSLGALALVSVLALRTIAPAIIAHVLFNIWTWIRARTSDRLVTT